MSSKKKAANDSREVIRQLFQAVASEEQALANLMNAEADKIHAFLGDGPKAGSKPTANDIVQFSYSTIEILDTLLMAEWMLMKKTNTIIRLDTQYHLHRSDKT